jgi:hypothetical protein
VDGSELGPPEAELLEQLTGAVRGTVVHQQDFIRLAQTRQDRAELPLQIGKAFRLVEQRDDHTHEVDTMR